MTIQMFRNRKNHWCRWLCVLFLIISADLQAQVTGVELQPLRVQIQRLIEAMDYLGNPLSPASKTKLQQAWKMDDPA
ncbi:MAG: hypothetical protein IID32_02825, partial [Planctomycetes bacterium]|nr:hypothetical protein [Planctomycetota bacterium]